MPRKHERLTFLTEIILESASGKREVRISDLSLGGCFIDSIVNVQPGEEVSLTLSLDSDKPLSLKGRVAYVLKASGFGIAFVDVPKDVEKRLRKIVPKGGD